MAVFISLKDQDALKGPCLGSGIIVSRSADDGCGDGDGGHEGVDAAFVASSECVAIAPQVLFPDQAPGLRSWPRRAAGRRLPQNCPTAPDAGPAVPPGLGRPPIPNQRKAAGPIGAR